MKHKTGELTGCQLDAAVALAEGVDYIAEAGVNGIGMEYDATHFSTDWGWAGRS